jgi:hypothetical protein
MAFSDEAELKRLFLFADVDRDGKIAPAEAVPFFRRSNLSDAVLGQVGRTRARQHIALTHLLYYRSGLQLRPALAS